MMGECNDCLMFTTFARLANATDGIPGDRVIDGADQSGVLLLGEIHGRRDYVHIYEGLGNNII